MFNLMNPNNTRSVKNDLLSGLTVALALVPEAVAFAFVAGVHPLVGLYAAFLMGLITSLIGGRPGMISGATGALAVVMVSLVAQHGVEYLFATVVLMGLIQIGAGIFKLGKFIRIVPYPVFLGFVNGLAIVIFLAQMSHFQVTNEAGESQWMSAQPLAIMLGLIALVMAISHFLPKLTRAVPAPLVGIAVASFIAIGLDLDTRSVGDLASIAGGFPSFHIPAAPLNFETLMIILPYAFILAAIGLIESLLTMTLIDEITETRGHGNRVCIGQGVANTVTGFFGGMGGCAMVGQSVINVESGGRTNLSGIAAAIFLLIFILFASQLIEMIPVAALVGVMFMVVIGTFEWGSFQLLTRIPRGDVFVGILVAVVTVLSDLAVAVFVGVVVSALMFAWEHAKRIAVETRIDENGAKVYLLSGPLFFSSAHRFQNLFDVHNDPNEVIIEFQKSRVCDHSAIEAIDSLAERYKKAGKNLHLRHLSPECRELLATARDLVEVNVIEDPRYHVADDKLG